MSVNKEAEERAKERAIERLREHGLTTLEGNPGETKTCEVCGSEEDSSEVIQECVMFQGILMFTVKCAMCRATEIERNEDRDDDKLSARLK